MIILKRLVVTFVIFFVFANAQAEVKKFKALPFAKGATRLRRWCDLGMNPGRKTKSFEEYYPLIKSFLKEE